MPQRAMNQRVSGKLSDFLLSGQHAAKNHCATILILVGDYIGEKFSVTSKCTRIQPIYIKKYIIIRSLHRKLQLGSLISMHSLTPHHTS